MVQRLYGSLPTEPIQTPEEQHVELPSSRRTDVSTGRGKEVFTIDTATNKPISSLEVGARPWGITLSPDAKTLYSANGPSNDVSVIDLATNTVAHRVKVGTGPWGVIALEPK
jgi:YVTN family beta-propeller protein